MNTGGAGSERPLQRLVTWALGPDVLRAEDVDHLVTVVTDTLAAVIGASVEAEVRGFAEVAPGLGGPGPATVLATGTGTGTSAAAAAMANGLAAVRLELDEGHPYAANHPSAHTLPAVLAVAEEVDASGPELLEAAAAAYEVAVRVARGMRLRREVHPFGTAMTCGAAAGVARLRGLDPATAEQAVLVAAGLTPASTQRSATSGATVRNAFTGVCAAGGVLAVELARTGTTGDPRALETVYGEVLGESFTPVHLDERLGELRYLTGGYFKLHACSRWNHAPIEATEALLATSAVRPADIAAVEVATYALATRLDRRDAATGFAGKHSIPYSVAARIVYGDNGVAAYTDEAAADPLLGEVMGRVSVVEDPAMTAATPAVRGARVTFRLRDGRTLSATENHPPGGADRPYPPETLAAKHRALLGRALTDDGVREVLGWCAALPTAGSVRGLERAARRRR
jgi:2-methylcitrate dehydratase PrpD